MKRVKIRTPENIDIEYKLADLGSRAAAAAIDLLIQSIVIIIVLGTVYYVTSDNLLNTEYRGWIIGGMMIFSALVSYGYFIVLDMTMKGRSIGKKILRLRVIRNNGQPITLKHSIIRNLFRLLIDNFGIGIILIFFTKEYKRVGDFTASTIVVAEEKEDSIDAFKVIDNPTVSSDYIISDEEYRLLKEFFSRDDISEKGYTKAERALGEYFRKKLEADVHESDFGKFLQGLIGTNNTKL